jgi:hypothetical protein
MQGRNAVRPASARTLPLVVATSSAASSATRRQNGAPARLALTERGGDAPLIA